MEDKRSKETLKNLFTDLDVKRRSVKKYNNLFLLSPTDLGVCRNGGRRGSSFGPAAIINVLKKMALPLEGRPFLSATCTVSDKELEDSNFKSAQKKSSQLIRKSISKFKGQNIFHIGGGHDHIYPLLKTLEKDHPRIKVINIDAHMDTRTDKSPHSGTPFRQFARESKGQFSLIQLGIHPFSNSLSTQSSLKGTATRIIPFEEFFRETSGFCHDCTPFLEREINVSGDELLIIGLDCDAIEASIMEGVSAVNHRGIPLKTVQEIFLFGKSKAGSNPSIFGIYEYNPVYDNLSQKGARAISSLIYNVIT